MVTPLYGVAPSLGERSLSSLRGLRLTTFLKGIQKRRHIIGKLRAVAGFAFRLLDRLPHEGDRVKSDDISIQITEMDVHRISRVRVAKGVDEEDFNREERFIHLSKEADTQSSQDRKIDDVAEDIEDTNEIDSHVTVDRVENQ